MNVKAIQISNFCICSAGINPTPCHVWYVSRGCGLTARPEGCAWALQRGGFISLGVTTIVIGIGFLMRFLCKYFFWSCFIVFVYLHVYAYVSSSLQNYSTFFMLWLSSNPNLERTPAKFVYCLLDTKINTVWELRLQDYGHRLEIAWIYDALFSSAYRGCIQRMIVLNIIVLHSQVSRGCTVDQCVLVRSERWDRMLTSPGIL